MTRSGSEKRTQEQIAQLGGSNGSETGNRRQRQPAANLVCRRRGVWGRGAGRVRHAGSAAGAGSRRQGSVGIAGLLAWRRGDTEMAPKRAADFMQEYPKIKVAV